MKLKMNSHVGGTNYLHWSNPWERDTTRGGNYEASPFPSMHSSELQETVLVAMCQCCGEYFGFTEPGKPKEFCPSHSWLATNKPLGVLRLTDIKYPDPYNRQVEVMGRGIQYSYFFPENDPREAKKLYLALRTWLVEEYLEQVGIPRLPKVTVTKQGVWVTDLQHLQVAEEGRNTSPISAGALVRLMKKMDQVYVEAL